VLVIARALDAVLESPSVTGAILADGATGLTYADAGEPEAVGDGAQLAELANLIADTFDAAGAAGRLESITVTAARQYQIIRALPGPCESDELLLGLVIDRADTNLALAMREAEELAEGLFA
jgi:hypothetical protein